MDLLNFVSDRVKILARGVWEEDSVTVNFDKEFVPKISEEIRVAALARLLTRKEASPALFNGEARHLHMIQEKTDGSVLDLALGPITYAVYDICRKEFIEEFGWEVEDLPIGVGMSATVITSDSKIIMHKRSQAVDFPGITALPGGILDENNPFNHVRKELWEELGIESDEIEKLLLLGISYRREQRLANELNFFSRISISSAEIMRRQPNVQENEGEVFFLDCDPETVHAFIREKHEEMLPGQVFCLIQAGRYLWKLNWSKVRAE